MKEFFFFSRTWLYDARWTICTMRNMCSEPNVPDWCTYWLAGSSNLGIYRNIYILHYAQWVLIYKISVMSAHSCDASRTFWKISGTLVLDEHRFEELHLDSNINDKPFIQRLDVRSSRGVALLDNMSTQFISLGSSSQFMPAVCMLYGSNPVSVERVEFARNI